MRTGYPSIATIPYGKGVAVKKHRPWHIGAIITAVLLMAVIATSRGASSSIDRGLNRVRQPPPYVVSEPIRALHQRLFIVDLHADSLLWGRDLGQRQAYGHVDLPRLVDGNVALQVFGVVTQIPRGRNIQHNTATTDELPGLMAEQGWPQVTRNSLLHRALYQAETLRALVDRSAGQLVLVQSRADLRRFVARRTREPHLIGALLALEGAHALEGDLANVDHVALGSDFDGAITAPMDASGLALLTAALVAAGFTEQDMAKILGSNVLRVLFATLPEE